MGTENQPIDSLERHLMEINRGQRRQERRRQISNPADLLGPGFGPTATQLLDWNSDEATFNGFFYSLAGEALNAPDDDVHWLGMVVASEDNLTGVQTVWSHDAAEGHPREFRRRWRDDGTGLTRTYSVWSGEGEWQNTGVTGVSGGTVTSQSWKRSGDVVSLTAVVQPPSLISVPANGNVINTPLAQVPASIVPSTAIPYQGLGSGALGRMTNWVVDSSGLLILVSVAPGDDIAAGADLSISGTYLL